MSAEPTEEEKEAEEEASQPKEKAPEWRKSKARDYLYSLLQKNEIPSRYDIKPRDVFDKYCKDRPEFKHFQDYKELTFASKLLYLRNRLEERGNRASEDAEALAHDRAIFPPIMEDTKGRPVWAGSKAQELLRKDLKDGLYPQLKPKQLFEKREEYYKDFDLDFFRNKIYQEIKAAKRVVWVKANEEKQKKKKK